jgi:hypothetical protein
MKIWMVVALAACGAKEPSAAGSGSTTPGSSSQPEPGEAPPKPAEAKFPDTQPDHALILADTPGGKVTFTLADKTTSELADGTIVEEHYEQFGESTVSSHGRTGTVELTHVIGSGAVYPAPSGVFAVLTPALAVRQAARDVRGYAFAGVRAERHPVPARSRLGSVRGRRWKDEESRSGRQAEARLPDAGLPGEVRRERKMAAERRREAYEGEMIARGTRMPSSAADAIPPA